MEAEDVVRKAVKSFAPPPDLTLSEWSDKFRQVSIGPSPGRWKTSRTPDLKEPMDCITDDITKGIVIIKPTRMGGTEAFINNPIGYHIHYDPCDMIYVQSTSDQTEIYSDSILMPMLRDTPVLAERLVHERGRRATQTKTKKFFRGGASLRLIGAKSPRGFQAIQGSLLTGDDVDEWDFSVHGDQVAKLIDRGKGLWNSKVVLVSYPTHILTSRIYYHYKRTDQRTRWTACPLCGTWQVLQFGSKKTDYGLKWRKSGEVWYECEKCQGHIEEYHKDEMNLHGEWRAEEAFNGWAGFKLNPFLRSWHRWEEIRDAFLMTGGEDVYKLMVFYNQTLGEVWIDDDGLGVDEHILFARREHYECPVPPRVKMLTFSVDTQDDRLECKVMGWASGEESWIIEHKIYNGSPVEQSLWDKLDNYLLSSFESRDADGNVRMMTLSGGMIDAGGHFSAQVYDFCKSRESRNIYAIIGSNNPKADILDGEKRTNKGSGARYWRIGVSACKDTLLGRLRIEKQDPEVVNHGYIHFPDTLELGYFEQLLGEKPVVNKLGQRRWEVVQGWRNEAMDLFNYNLATMRMLAPDWESIELGSAFDMGRKVYREYQYNQHIDDSITVNPNLPVISCWGFGKNPLVCVLAQTDGNRVWVFEELYVTGGDAANMARELMKRYGGHPAGIHTYGSARGSIRSSSSQSEYAILTQYGFGRAATRRLDPSDLDRVEAVNTLLADIGGQVRLTIHPHCVNLRKDLEQCLWTEDRDAIDRVNFGRGNAADALGHFIVYKWPLRSARPNKGRTHWK